MADVLDPARDPFARLRAATNARIGLGRVGQALPTAPMLALQLAHARARDAVDAALDVEGIRAALGRPTLDVRSAAADRAAYLRDPGLGRRPAPDTPVLPHGDYDLGVVIADGLSARAANAHAAAVTLALAARLPGWSLAPIVLAHQARVALGDAVGAALGARAVVVLLGERPGLSAADSLGAYVTFDPRPGRPDSERNCVSNIRHPEGLAPDLAADRIAWLLRESRRLGFTGVELKDRSSEAARLPAAPDPLAVAGGSPEA